MKQQNPNINIDIYGIAVNTREALGVLHLKGMLFDDTLLYSGASINDVYLHQHDKYRYDRYQIIKNPELVRTMKSFIDNALLDSEATQRLDSSERPRTIDIKSLIKQFRISLKSAEYLFLIMPPMKN